MTIVRDAREQRQLVFPEAKVETGSLAYPRQWVARYLVRESHDVRNNYRRFISQASAE